MAKKGPKTPVDVRGFVAVNLLVQRAIGKVKEKAKNRARESERFRNHGRTEDEKASAARASAKYARARRAADPHGWSSVLRQRDERAKVRKAGGPIAFLMANSIQNILKTYKRQDQHESNRLYNNDYRRERYSTDACYKMICRLRARLHTYARTTGRQVAEKPSSTMDMIGLSQDNLTRHLGVTVDVEFDGNEIDHTFPLCAYNLTEAENVKRVMHLSSLQLIGKAENRDKSGKLPTKAMANKVEKWAWPPGVTEDMLPDIYAGWATPLRKEA